MATYTFRNKDTGEIEEHKFSVHKHQEFKDNNPHLEQVILTTPAFGDLVRMGMKGPDDGFREVLSKIKEKTGGRNNNLKNKLSRNWLCACDMFNLTSRGIHGKKKFCTIPAN